MLNVKVEIKGDRKVIAQLRAVMGSFQNWKPELQAVGDYLKDFYRDPVFETEGGIFGERWLPLNTNYAIRKAKPKDKGGLGWGGRGILEASGTMRKSYDIRVFASLLQLVNPVEYAVYHQEGRGVPERVLVKVDDERKNRIVDIFKKGVLIKIEKSLKAS